LAVGKKFKTVLAPFSSARNIVIQPNELVWSQGRIGRTDKPSPARRRGGRFVEKPMLGGRTVAKKKKAKKKAAKKGAKKKK
jgi:hypothetical protein